MADIEIGSEESFKIFPIFKRCQTKLNWLKKECTMRYNETNNELYFFNKEGMEVISLGSEKLEDFIKILRVVHKKMNIVMNERFDEKNKREFDEKNANSARRG